MTVSATEAGRTVIGTFNVTVADTVGPDLTMPQDVFVVSNVSGGAMVSLDVPTATDLVDLQPTVVSDRTSGFFPIGTTTVTWTATDAAGNGSSGSYSVIVVDGAVSSSSVVGRRLFYNQSGTAAGPRYDGNNVAINSLDDNAIATDKVAYTWEDPNPATFANVSSYTKGINGIMIDISGTHGSISADDFIFRVGNNNAPGTWAAAISPTGATDRSRCVPGPAWADRIA